MSTVEPPSKIISTLCEERQRLIEEVAQLRQRESVTSLAHSEVLVSHAKLVTMLSKQIEAMHAAFHTVTHLQDVIENIATSEASAADDDEESLLELYELRRWKRNFCADQTRHLVNKFEALQADLDKIRSACTCGAASHRPDSLFTQREVETTTT
jgi:hypothetical protein